MNQHIAAADTTQSHYHPQAFYTMEASKGVTLPKNIIIDPDGDVVLVLEGAELQVSSKVLSLASNVFKAMFGPYFAEGKATTSNHPCRVNLSEDDPELMAILCNILHHRTQSVARKPELHFLEQLAILIDKYDCSDSLRSWTQLWLIVLYTEAEDRSAVGRLLYPAFIGDDAQAFQKITRTMVLEVGSNTHSGLYTPYQIKSEIQGLLPDGLLGKLTSTVQLLEHANQHRNYRSVAGGGAKSQERVAPGSGAHHIRPDAQGAIPRHHLSEG